MMFCLSQTTGIDAREAWIVPGDAGDHAARLQAAMLDLHRKGGGTLKLAPGTVTRCRRAPVIPEDVTLDLNGATLELMLGEGNDQGVRLRSRATLCNGTIRVTSTGRPSWQSGVHAPVCVGPIYGEGGTASAPSPDENVRGWAIRDLILSSDKSVNTPAGPLGAVAIQITGNASDGMIERITIPDSDTMSGAVHLDWGVIGPVTSRDDPIGLDASRRAFEAGISWTTHPHDITIRDIRIGRLTGGKGGPDGGSDAIRLSGCYRVTVSNVRATATSGVFLRHTAGDLGFEFGRTTRPGLDGNRFTDCTVDDCLDGRLFISDSMADNVARGVAQGYRAQQPVILTTDVVFDRIAGNGHGRADGGVFVHQSGGRAIRCRANGFAAGFRIDAGTRAITLEDCLAQDNKLTGFLVEHSVDPPRDCMLIAPTARDNGSSAGDANITIGASTGTTIVGGNIGRVERPDRATYGIRVKQFSDGCRDATIEGTPFIASHAQGGAAFAVSSDEGWGAVRLFTGGRYGAFVQRPWVGLSIVPTKIDRQGRILTVAPGRKAEAPRGFPTLGGDRFVVGPIG